MDRPGENLATLLLDDRALLAECEVDVFKASGPGGQHRNKVSTAIRLRHRPTGVEATGQDSRSQQDNRAAALCRLRMHIACRCRCPVETLGPPPDVVAECLHASRGAGAGGRRLRVGRRDRRFWPVAAWVLDVLADRQGQLAPTAALLGLSTGQLAAFLRSQRHLLAAAVAIRRRHGHGPIR